MEAPGNGLLAKHMRGLPSYPRLFCLKLCKQEETDMYNEIYERKHVFKFSGMVLSDKIRSKYGLRFLYLLRDFWSRVRTKIEQSVLMVLVFYEKCMLEKETMQRTLQLADFSLLSKEPS